MEIKFIEISPVEVKTCFPWFYSENMVFFEIMKDDMPIGFYGIKDVGNKVGEISVYINENRRNEITKKVATKCLIFPSNLGFEKVLISTQVGSIERFLKKMEKLGRFGVKYLFKNDAIHWFEVNYEL